MPMMFFHFLKIIFDISTSKRSKKYKPHSILAKKKNSKFDKTQLQTQCQTVSRLRVNLTRSHTPKRPSDTPAGHSIHSTDHKYTQQGTCRSFA
jgi:hypothetical protein